MTSKPAGCELVKPGDLAPTSPYRAYAPAYFCDPTGFIRAGTTVWLPFSLRIDRAGTSTARLRLIDTWPALYRDGNPANNTATLSVTGTSGGAGGGDGGLPITGGAAGRLAATGALFVLAGLGMLAATRRRAT